jgi:hypothetical protein
MTTQTIYAYTNISRDTIMVGENDLSFTGTWSSSGTYWAESKDTVEYGNGLFIALVDNINVIPTFIPRKGQRKWAELAVIRAGTQTDEHTVDQAYALADRALGQADFAVQIAVAGTNAAAAASEEASDANDLAYTALLTAWSGTNGVDQAIAIAVNGTNAATAGIAAAAASAGAGINQAIAIAVAGTNAAAAAQSTANAAGLAAVAAQADADAAQATATAAANASSGFSFVIDGGGAPILTGFKGFVEMPYNMWVTGWTVVADQSGTIGLDVYKSNGYSGFPTVPSVSDADRPTLPSAQKNRNTNITAWTDQQFNKGDLVGFNVHAAGVVQIATISLSGTRN